MSQRSLAQWLAWQETLNPAEIDLGLDRVGQVLANLQIERSPGAVFTIAGTNGKGSCAAVLAGLLQNAGRRTGLYSSPHLVRYNERICVAGRPVSDAEIVAAFEAIELARGEIPLTFFEYGTLAAVWLFADSGCDAWVLEVGLGGRLDAVNIIEPDVGVITTIGLDHQAWLGDTVEVIAAEKAGIMRAGKPLCYGDRPVPASITRKAKETGAELLSLGSAFEYELDDGAWSWRGRALALSNLPAPPSAGEEQIRNISVALAAAEAFDETLLADQQGVRQLLAGIALPGRFQLHQDAHRWILDVAHNPQAARALARKLVTLDKAPVTVVLALQADKDAVGFVQELLPAPVNWIACGVDGYRARSAHELAAVLADAVAGSVSTASSVEVALEQARTITDAGDCILICGSFSLVGPALEALGLY